MRLLHCFSREGCTLRIIPKRYISSLLVMDFFTALDVVGPEENTSISHVTVSKLLWICMCSFGRRRGFNVVILDDMAWWLCAGYED